MITSLKHFCHCDPVIIDIFGFMDNYLEKDRLVFGPVRLPLFTVLVVLLSNIIKFAALLNAGLIYIILPLYLHNNNCAKWLVAMVSKSTVLVI